MATTADIKKGLCIKFKDDLWTITDFQHHKPGKGGAFMRTRLKSVTSGKTLEHTFSSGENIDIQSISRRKFQFTYKDETGYNFMDNETFEQITLQEDEIEGVPFMKDGQDVEVVIHDETEKALFAELPAFVNLMITYTEPGIQGDRSSGGTKPATVETGIEIQVPLFIKQDEVVLVDTRDGSYQGRAN